MTGTIIYSDPFIPAEWIAAHGFHPGRIIPRSVKEALSLNVTTGVCPYALAFADYVTSEAKAAAVVTTTTCDQMRRISDVLRLNCKLPLFLMNVPSTWQTPTAQKLYISELRRLGKFLESLGGKAPSNDELAEIMREFDDGRSAIRSARGYLSGRDFSETIARFHREGKADIDIPKESKSTSKSTKAIPLALIGGPLMKDDFFIFDLLEKLGGRIVLDGTETGERTVVGPYERRRLRDDPFMTLAEAYFGSIPDVCRRPNSEFYKWLKKELKERDARGIILRRYLWCDLWHAEARRLKEWTQLPLLDVDTVGDTLAENRLAERIQSLLETIT